MLRIGAFSRFTSVSVKTLRHYDEIGLLPPAHVDPQTGYRLYSASQLPRLHRILALKDLGLSLEQVGLLLGEGVTADQLRGMLRLRRAEQQARVREELDRLTRIEVLLHLMEQEEDMTDEAVAIKDVAPQWIASIRETIPTYQDVGRLYPDVFAGLNGAAVQGQPPLTVALWHDQEYREREVDAEAGVYLPAPVAASGRVTVRELPAQTMASIVHHGSYRRLSQAYEAVMRWVEASGYRAAGPIRELYLHCTQPVMQDDESYVTEIQVPVERR